MLALMVALGGISYAAIKIPRGSVGTVQLRNNAVTSQKVRNGTLRIRDFASAEAPASTWFAARDASTNLDLTNSLQTVVQSPRLPPGSYVLLANADLQFPSESYSVIFCSLGNNVSTTASQNTLSQLSLQGIITLPASARVALSCQKGGSGNPTIGRASLIAMRVTSKAGFPD